MFALLMGIASVSPKELLRLVEANVATVIDVNSRQSWERAHVPGALNLDPTAFAPSDLPADRQTPLVFYCSNPMCRKAPSAARRAKSFGYVSVRVLSAGISGWLDARLPVEGAT